LLSLGSFLPSLDFGRKLQCEPSLDEPTFKASLSRASDELTRASDELRRAYIILKYYNVVRLLYCNIAILL